MARETVTKVIKGSNYEFSQYGAKQGLKTLLRLGKLIGKPIALGYAAFQKNEEGVRDVKADILAQAVESLMQNAHQDEVLDLCIELSSRNCLCDGKQIDFNSHYEGDFGLMFEVIAAALEVQYGNFFVALSGLPGVAPTQPAPSKITNQGHTT